MRERFGRRGRGLHPANQVGHNAIFNAMALTVLASDVESLKRGVIKTSKNKAKVAYTILLVGETGVGKSSVLEFIANVFAGNDTDHYNFDALDHSEGGGTNNQGQTSTGPLYELSSKNGTVVSSGVCERDRGV